MKKLVDSYKTHATLSHGSKSFKYASIAALPAAEKAKAAKLPFSLKVLLENMLRREDGVVVKKADVDAILNWNPKAEPNHEIQFMPGRVVLQDFTGVPCVADLAAMRAAVKRLGGNPQRINPLQPVDLVIDHSVQIDHYGSSQAIGYNAHLEFERNKERYEFLKWGQSAFKNFRVVPPATGIVHQVNLECLAPVAMTFPFQGEDWVFPDTCVGTDSHTPMVNALGVVGWGVGGIEAEAAMLGQPCSMLVPQVIGMRLSGRLNPGVTATDMVLTITQILRKRGVVGKFVEYFGPGLESLSISHRATISNMAPEYGATIGIFAIDKVTLAYMRLTGRADQSELAEKYYKAQGMFAEAGAPEAQYTDVLDLDLSSVQPSLAGPARPQDRVNLPDARKSFRTFLASQVKPAELGGATEADVKGWIEEKVEKSRLAPELMAVHPDQKMGVLGKSVPVRQPDGQSYNLTHGSVVIASITSCTNTSNPYVLMAAGLLARNAVRRGLSIKPWVKTSLAPGSKVVTEYLIESGMLSYLEALKFHVVGYGCATCIGNSGPLPDHVQKAVVDGNLSVASVLSGNRNFEARVHPNVRANYLASPPLVVAYALAGDINIDLTTQPLGRDPNGDEVYLKDIWPSDEEVSALVDKTVTAPQFARVYKDVFAGDTAWKNIKAPTGDLYAWDAKSTYIKQPPFVETTELEPAPVSDITGARVLGYFGDSVTTDHISPAGNIGKSSPAGQYLSSLGVENKDYNSYGARRGNHEVMVRGTFANVRIKNMLVPGVEGGVTADFTDGGKQTSIYDAAMHYRAKNIPTVILAGKEYGSGSSRDWAAKGPALQGVKAAIAESYERIHRSNLVGMGILPLQFTNGQSPKSLGLTGEETFDIRGVSQLQPGQKLKVVATMKDGSKKEIEVLVRIDTANELEYFYNGGILPYVLRQIIKA
ncbi:MAG: aconitate hydratase AcnA [Bdellovibrionales bacterium]|nr:aconitate hydratase AcnA [Bdellovibrionales bacterium]